MKHFLVHICFLSLCNKAVGNEFFQKKKIMYVNKGKLPTSGISQPILQLVILNLSSDRRKPFGFWRARFGAPKNLRSLFPSEVTEPNSLALREGYLKAGEARPTSIKGNHTLVHVIVSLFRDVKAVIIFINRQYSSLVVLLEGQISATILMLCSPLDAAVDFLVTLSSLNLFLSCVKYPLNARVDLNYCFVGTCNGLLQERFSFTTFLLTSDLRSSSFPAIFKRIHTCFDEPLLWRYFIVLLRNLQDEILSSGLVKILEGNHLGS